MREQARLTMENLKKTLEAAGCTLRDLVSATRYLTTVEEQDDLNRYGVLPRRSPADDDH
jgi:enamine deaminase RidA (YjgF/YER057c/UK114 family)